MDIKIKAKLSAYAKIKFNEVPLPTVDDADKVVSVSDNGNYTLTKVARIDDQLVNNEYTWSSLNIKNIIDSKCQEIESQVQELIEYTEDKIGLINAKLTLVDSKLSNITSTVDIIETSLGEKSDDNTKDTAFGRIAQNALNIQSTNQTVSTINSKVDTLQTEMNNKTAQTVSYSNATFNIYYDNTFIEVNSVTYQIQSENFLSFTSVDDIWNFLALSPSAYIPIINTIVTINNQLYLCKYIKANGTGKPYSGNVYYFDLYVQNLTTGEQLKYKASIERLGDRFIYSFMGKELINRKSLRGDVNLSGSVDIRDSTALSDYLSSGDAQYPLECYDVSDDGKIDIRDYTALQDLLSGKNSYPLQ